MRPRLIFMVGGPDFHPVNAQAEQIIAWLGPDYACHMADSLAAFEHLSECDLLVLMGQHWTGFEGRYRSPSEVHRRNFEKYVQSGLPILTVHGAICSFDDWPRFGELVGFTWTHGVTSHSPLGDYTVEIVRSGHPIVADLDDFTIHDELYYDVGITPGLDVQVHAEAPWEGKRLPMIFTARGGRMAGACKTAFLANGHDKQTYRCPAMEKLWLNAVRWCLADQ